MKFKTDQVINILETRLGFSLWKEVYCLDSLIRKSKSSHSPEKGNNFLPSEVKILLPVSSHNSHKYAEAVILQDGF